MCRYLWMLFEVETNICPVSLNLLLDVNTSGKNFVPNLLLFNHISGVIGDNVPIPRLSINY